MVASWSCAEIPRYLFYIFAQLQAAEDIPFVLFFLRYSLFMVLYPTGISGECLQMYAFYSGAKLPADQTMVYVTMAIGVVYVFGGPGMVGNMLANRKREFKKRKEALEGKKAK